MIITITPNPSIDVALSVDHLEVGEVNRATDVRRDPAGKGVNVARALAANGIRAGAVFPADSAGGAQLVSLLSATNVELHPVPIAKPIRQNITVLDDNGTTKINEGGPLLSATELAELTSTIVSLLDANPRWLVIAGSLPPGVDGDWLVEVGTIARAKGIPFAADVSGDALAAITRAGVATLIKPNNEELTELLGTELRTIGDIVQGARSILAHPDSQALVSLGKNGALLVTPQQTWWAGTPPLVPVSTVGAGDSTLAGFISLETDDPAERLVTGVAWGAAAVTLPGTQAPTSTDIHPEAVRLVAEPHPLTLIGEITQ